jgi:glycosyltransferase involved in cell wall biosynthesis
MIIGIDASRNRSGGAIAYLIGLILDSSPQKYGVKIVHLWAPKDLNNKLPNYPWLIKHNLDFNNILIEILWQKFLLKKRLKESKCDLLYSTDASTFCRFNPMIVLSQDMLSYETGVMKYFGWGLKRIRLLLILFLQNDAFKYSKKVIFLTKYASDVIQRSCGKIKNIKIIPHGVSDDFRKVKNVNDWNFNDLKYIECVYVSNIDMYKHQWEVVSAISNLIKDGFKIRLTLIGEAETKANKKLNDIIKFSGINNESIIRLGKVNNSSLPSILQKYQIFIFASSCENLPITLLEGMACGIPIACSNRGPMKEVLINGGEYFDPENYKSIEEAIKKIILDKNLRIENSINAKSIASKYTWDNCSNETWKFLTN